MPPPPMTLQHIGLFFVVPWVVLAALIVLVWFAWRRMGWQLAAYLLSTFFCGAMGLTLFGSTPDWRTVIVKVGIYFIALACVGVLLGIVEFALMPAVGFFRLGAIARATYYEVLLQPFTIIIIAFGFIMMVIAQWLQYFTYNEDFKMFRDVASSFVFLFSLPVMVFAATKSIDEEIENRTMLTLMSKPVSRWQVILGKYLGVVLLSVTAVGALGIVAGFCSHLYYMDDKTIDYSIAARGAPGEWQALEFANYKAFLAYLPGLALTFLQVITLAAISVAVSTRWGLAVNVTVVVLIYIGANLARFAQSATDLPGPLAALASVLTYLLPGTTLLDLNQRLVFGEYLLPGRETDFSMGTLPTYGRIWQYVGLSGIYAVFYIGAALSMGMALFRSRELT